MIAPDLSLLAAAALLLVLGAGLALALGNRPLLSHRIAYGCAAVASLCALGGAGAMLVQGRSLRAELFPLAPLTTYTLHIDALGAIFIALTGFVGLSVSLFAWGYALKYVRYKRVGYLGALFNLFLLSMGLVVSVDDVLGFLLTWELMALLSFFLVAFDHEQPETRKASILYAAMTQLGMGFLAGSFLLLASHASGLGFADIREAAATMPWPLKGLAFVGFLVGFGAKAGMFPLHGWLPEAHPAAPAHVSALMSAVMIKTGLYGLIRVAFDLMGGGPTWWGMTVLALGAITAALGAFYAVIEGDLKRLLAFSSIENVGIVLIGLGAAMVMAARHLPELAVLGLVAAIFHLINHAAFKGLLFCGAGAIQYATHTRQLDRLGGLIRVMPATALLFLLGSASLSALPPLNGFASEWLTFQALVAGARITDPSLRVLLPLALGTLALTSGLALVASVKAFSIAFLARPRSDEARHAREVPRVMLAGMVLPALACVGLGVFSGGVVRGLTGMFGQAHRAWVVLPHQVIAPIETPLAALCLPAVLLVLLVAGLAVVLVPHRIASAAPVRRGPTWGCGGELTGNTQYTAQGYAQPLRSVLGKWLLASAQTTYQDDTLGPFYRLRLRYNLYVQPITEKWLYEPVGRWVSLLSHQVTRLQSGSIHLYLAYIFVVLLVVLFAMRWIG